VHEGAPRPALTIDAKWRPPFFEGETGEVVQTLTAEEEEMIRKFGGKAGDDPHIDHARRLRCDRRDLPFDELAAPRRARRKLQRRHHAVGQSEALSRS
jgi:hypothetical protein